MMSDQVLDKLDRLAGIAEKFNKTMEKVPRLIGMAGTALFAANASKRLGGDPIHGAIGGAVAHDLAHSQLPNNQVGGVALALYLSAIGLTNIIPPITEVPPMFDTSNTFDVPLEPNEQLISRQDCMDKRGTIQSVVLKLSGWLGFDGPQDMVVCLLPPRPPEEGGVGERPIGNGSIRR